VRAEAATCVAYLEDKSALPQLEDWLSHENDGRVRRRIRETITILKQYSSKEKQEDLEKQIEVLEERIVKLESKLDKLDTRNR
jgi:predicted  nucleic acid-binding Zn-ribbon protein